MNMDELINKILTNDSELTALDFMASEDISLDDLARIVDALKSNTKIESISFLDNNLSDRHIDLISSILCRSLTNISLQNSNITDERLECLLRIDTLRFLNISYNGLTDIGAHLIASHPHLTDVAISFNCIGNAGVTALLSSNKLHRIHADGNIFDMAVSDVVFQNKTITEISLRNERISRDENNKFKLHASLNAMHAASVTKSGFFKPPVKDDSVGSYIKKSDDGCSIS